ncbi:MAG TPA: AzlD domain-containing protein [Treponemataceae bacterium]|jgi:branched-subunit amino acid transport protein AzlD|nr:AzlD domain-containing protein [Treponemataceae bacterium]HPX25283.1 AzlD domain-containing protein [Treponemataceae bacterium]
MNSLNISSALFYTLCFALIIFLTRLFPFALFSKRQPPRFLRFAAHYMPPMVMMVLIIYCLRTVSFLQKPFGLPHICGIVVTVMLHAWKKNAMISITGATLVFMTLSSFFLEI